MVNILDIFRFKRLSEKSRSIIEQIRHSRRSVLTVFQRIFHSFSLSAYLGRDSANRPNSRMEGFRDGIPLNYKAAVGGCRVLAAFGFAQTYVRKA